MRSQTQGLLASLLMFTPLLAVPFVASVGVPWLAAKAKTEGVPVPDLDGPSLLGTGVGQSNTARHSPDDLFAPVATHAAVDLRMAPSSPASAQNPHLRNVSLVVSHNEAWIDPFENINSAPLPTQTSPQATQSVNPTSQSPQKALENWMLKEEAPDEFKPSEAPAPQDFSEATLEEPSISVNPFAVLEAAMPKTSRGADSPVAVADNAFEDPLPERRSHPDQNSFDASHTLFGQNESPSVPERTVERDPTPSPLARVGVNVANHVQEPSNNPLTWETARNRLKELGINDYYLQPDPAGQQFLFRCAYTPADNPRINRVFEAEDPDPLAAVQKVLGQVENWTLRQSASTN